MNTLIRTRRYLIAALLVLSPLAAVDTAAMDTEKPRVSHLDKHTAYAELQDGGR